MNPARLLMPSTYAEAAQEAADLANLIRELPRHVDSLAVSAARLAEAAETLASVVEPLVMLQQRMEGPLGMVGDRMRKMSELQTRVTPGRRRRPAKPGEPAGPEPQA